MSDEAQSLSEQLKAISFTEVLTSPLQRARKTAELACFEPVIRMLNEMRGRARAWPAAR